MVGDHGPYFGKYRGKVLNNIDPLVLGRVLAEVPAVPGGLLNWALPCTPYAGPNVGFYAIPPIGANVWIEFEGGDADYPIWAGCFWAPGETPQVAGMPSAETKIFKTGSVTLVMNDLPGVGGFTLTCDPPAAGLPVSLRMTSIGATIACADTTIAITPSGTTIRCAGSTIAVTPEGVSIDPPAISGGP